MEKSLTEATVSVHGILEPFPSEDRRRIVEAVFVLLGESSLTFGRKQTAPSSGDGDGTELPGELPSQAKAWMQKNGVSIELIEQFVHLEQGKTTVIELPLNNGSARERTQFTYLMTGLASLLEKGDPSFTDDVARGLCTHFGCHDKTNHSTYVKALGNSLTGSKASRWKLTAPGLTAVADAMKKVPASA